jgi:hypothetical protein
MIKIALTGRCVDATTGKPIEEAYVSRDFEELKINESGAFLYSTPVLGVTHFLSLDNKNYLLDQKLLPRDYRFVVTAPGYQPKEFVISPHDSILTYTNNIEMKPNVPTNGSAPAR